MAKSSHERPEVISVAFPAEEPSAWSYCKKISWSMLLLPVWSLFQISNARQKTRASTYRHFIHRLSSRVRIKEGIIQGPDSIDTEAGKGGLVWGAFHCQVLKYKVRLACLNIKFPDASQYRIGNEDKMVMLVKMSHAIEQDRRGHAAYLMNDGWSQDFAVGTNNEGAHIDGVNLLKAICLGSSEIELVWRELRNAAC